MTDFEITDYDARLERRLLAFVDIPVRPVDADAVARSAHQVGGGLRWRLFGRLGGSAWSVGRPAVGAYVLVLLAIVLAAGAVVVGASLLLQQLQPEVTPRTNYQIVPTGSLQHERNGHTATLLRNGQVLIVGGWSGVPVPNTNVAELYDPAAGVFTDTGRLPPPRQAGGHTATLLADGRVLVTGGGNEYGEGLADAHIYDVADGTFTPVGQMVEPRQYHSAVLLDDGRVLIAGGGRLPAEIFDPMSRTFSLAPGPGPGGQLESRPPVLVKLADGRIFVAGFGGPEMIFDPRSGDTVEMAEPDVARRSARGGVLLADGRVLLAADSGAFTFDPASGSHRALPPLGGRPVSEPALVGDGRVVMMVFDESSCQSLHAVLYDPRDDSVVDLGPVPGIGGCNGVGGTTATSLANGDVLIAGGDSSGGIEVDAASLVHAVVSDGESPEPSAARNGLIAYTMTNPGQPVGNFVHLVNADGSNDRVLLEGFGPTFSQDGSRLAYVTGFGVGRSQLWVANADGSDPREVPGYLQIGFEMSPDGSQVALRYEDGSSVTREYRSVSVTDGTARTVIPEPANPRWKCANLAWSPDGNSIACVVMEANDGSRPGPSEYAVGVDVYDVATGVGRRVSNRLGGGDWGLSWAPDSRSIVFAAWPEGTPESSLEFYGTITEPARDIFVVGADGEGEVNLTNSPGWEQQPAWAPDGSAIAYLAVGKGEFNLVGFQVAVLPMADLLPTSGPRLGPAAYQFVWSPDSSMLLFARADPPPPDGDAIRDDIQIVDAKFAMEPRTLISADYEVGSLSWQRLAP